jgi:hypothetical protein
MRDAASSVTPTGTGIIEAAAKAILPRTGGAFRPTCFGVETEPLEAPERALSAEPVLA